MVYICSMLKPHLPNVNVNNQKAKFTKPQRQSHKSPTSNSKTLTLSQKPQRQIHKTPMSKSQTPLLKFKNPNFKSKTPTSNSKNPYVKITNPPPQIQKPQR